MKHIQTEFINLEDDGCIAVLHLDHPESNNALSLEMGMTFQGELNRLAGMEPLPRVLVLTGQGDVFSSGGDPGLLRGFIQNPPLENRDFMDSYYRLFLKVRDVPFPVIAAVNGSARGAALALALACDIRYFSIDGEYTFDFVRQGLHPGMGSTFLLKEIAGLGQAQELLLTGRTFNGEEALRRGLCHGTDRSGEILDRALETATLIASAAPGAIRLCKRILYKRRTLEETISLEAEHQAQGFATEDFREAMEAILENRKPVFHDR